MKQIAHEMQRKARIASIKQWLLYYGDEDDNDDADHDDVAADGDEDGDDDG